MGYSVTRSGISRGAILLILLIAAGAGLSCKKAVSSAGEPPLSPDTRLRGFSVPNLNRTLLEDAKNDWNANSVRFHPGLGQDAKRAGFKTKREYWPEYLKNLETGLNHARDLNLAVIIAMPWPALYEPDPKLPNNENIARFWDNEANLDELVQCWKDIATLCKGREQILWFDILNEPLDRRDMPSYPKKWPAWAQKVIDEIRKIDSFHPIVVEVGPGGLSWGFWEFPRLKGEPLIYSFHQYQPHEYTHQGIADVSNTDLAHAYLERQKSWPGKFGDSGGGFWDKKRIEQELQPVLAFQKRNPDARLYCGEFSVVRWAPDADRYLKDNLEIFEKHGWDWSYHAFREFHGWSPEYDEAFPDGQNPKKADGTTKRGQVLKQFLMKNADSIKDNR